MLPAGKRRDLRRRFVVDDFARFMKVLTLIGSAATLILSTRFPGRDSSTKFEYPV